MDVAESALSAPRATIVALDQNMWIDLARAVKAPQDHPQARGILELLVAKVGAGEVRLPLTATNLFETHKVDDLELRAVIAETQVTLSRGMVFRCRAPRLRVEVARVLSHIYALPWTEPDSDWVFSSYFFEAHAELGAPGLVPIPERMLAAIRANPPGAMFDHLVALDDATRRQAVVNFEVASERLRDRMEERRLQHRDEPVSMRRKIYSVLLALDDQDAMILVGDRLGLPDRFLADNNGATMRMVVNETPALVIEREIALKLEGQARALHINDMRDMRNFVTVLPYADIFVAEKMFTNLARQAGLADRYRARLETDLGALADLL